jgi:periplasmic protein TonB
MIKLSYKNRLALLSVMGAASMALLLELMISVISHNKQQPEIKPALVINLLSMKSPQPIVKKPRAPVQQKTKASPNKNVLKKTSKPKQLPPVKKNEKSLLAKNPKVKSKPAKHITAVTQTRTVATAKTKQLPQPVPFFQLTESPRFFHKEMPVYPEAMRSVGNTGEVRLTALIDKFGKVRKVEITKSAGLEFDREATKAMLASTFFPAKIDGKPVAVLLKLPIKFNLL